MMVSIRMYGPEQFSLMMKEFEKSAERFYALGKYFFPELESLKRNKDLGLNPRQLYELALRVCCENSDINLISTDPRATLEIVAWAKTFTEGYLAIWDAPKGMEFILGDCSMVSEYEGSFRLTGGLSLSKRSYCHYRLKHPEHDLEVFMQARSIALSEIMYENYNVFNLSSTRSIVLVHPFFGQYYGLKQVGPDHEQYVAKPPDIWPSILQDKVIFKPPVTEHKAKYFTMDDLFFYEPRILTPDDLVYVNFMIISAARETIGFNDFAAVSDSIDFFLWANASMANGPFLSLQDKEDILKFCDSLMFHPMMKLSQICRGKQGDNRQSYPIDLFENVTENMLRDFRTNKYIYHYLLDNLEQTKAMPNLAFLGDPEQRVKAIKERYQELWGKPYGQ